MIVIKRGTTNTINLKTALDPLGLRLFLRRACTTIEVPITTDATCNAFTFQCTPACTIDTGVYTAVFEDTAGEQKTTSILVSQ